VSFPHEPFNETVRNGTAGGTINSILEEIKPEAVYFTEQDGHRGAILVVNVESPSQVPALSEPFFLNCWRLSEPVTQRGLHVSDRHGAWGLEQSGLDSLGEKWG
jgi:hypothetical protein